MHATKAFIVGISMLATIFFMSSVRIQNDGYAHETLNWSKCSLVTNRRNACLGRGEPSECFLLMSEHLAPFLQPTSTPPKGE